MAKRTKKPGPGKKACPECGALMGVRTQTCPKCEHQFSFKAKAKAAPKAKPQGNDLESLLLHEKEEIEKALANRVQMEKRLKAINELLKTM